MPQLQGRVAVVTGGTGGIGRATALRLAADGAAVVVADVREAETHSVAREIADAGGRSLAVPVDVSSEPQVAALVETVVREFGGIDVIHNNAAATGPETLGSDLDVVNTDVEVWDRTMAVNVRGMMLLCKHGIPSMVERGGGSIINMSSTAGLSGDASRAAYGVSKGAINALTMNVATAYGKQNVRCNAIAPGLVMTAAAEDLLPPPVVDVFLANHLTPQICEPRHIAAVVSYLASDDAAFITGEVIRVDGGMLSHLPMYAQLNALHQEG